MLNLRNKSLAIALGGMLALAACVVPPPAAPQAAAPKTDTATTAPAATAALNTSGATLTVFAAASLQAAFGEIGKNFEAANDGVKVAFNFAGSQQLAQQLSQGAPADVFASANGTQLNIVVTAGRIVSGTARTFVRNRLVVVFPANNPGKVQALKDLANPGLKLVLAAKAVPVGQYALDFLSKASAQPDFGETYSKMVIANVVSYEENVKAVLAKVALGEADAGIVYSTDVTPDVKEKVKQLAIPDALNTIASYPIAVIEDSKNADLAKKFVGYVLSDEGQKVLALNGFMAP